MTGPIEVCGRKACGWRADGSRRAFWGGRLEDKAQAGKTGGLSPDDCSCTESGRLQGPESQMKVPTGHSGRIVEGAGLVW